MKRSLALILIVFAVSFFGMSLAPQQDSFAAGRELALHNRLGVQYARMGELDDALAEFSWVLAKNESEAAALNNAANIHFLRENFDKARELYEKALESAPKEGGIHLNIGVLLHELDEPKLGKEHLRSGLALFEDVEHAYYLLGLSKGRKEAGRASDSEAFESGGIESLLEEALQEIPQVDSTAVRTTVAQGKSTRAMGSRAARQDVQTDNLFWMFIDSRP